MFGMTSPLQGATIVHACATILGLDLSKQLPQTTLVITGMRKTNDLTQGHNFIVKAFKLFGKIDEAAIAPNNRGFGKYLVYMYTVLFHYIMYMCLICTPYCTLFNIFHDMYFRICPFHQTKFSRTSIEKVSRVWNRNPRCISVDQDTQVGTATLV